MKLGKCLSLLFLDNKTAEFRFDLTFGLVDLAIIIITRSYLWQANCCEVSYKNKGNNNKDDD